MRRELLRKRERKLVRERESKKAPHGFFRVFSFTTFDNIFVVSRMKKGSSSKKKSCV
jgi:hypothetical protein